MTMRLLGVIGVLVMSAIGPPAIARIAPSPGVASIADTVYVTPPSGERDADRASILGALKEVQPGGTILFAPGIYAVGPLIPSGFVRDAVELLGRGGR